MRDKIIQAGEYLIERILVGAVINAMAVLGMLVAWGWWSLMKWVFVTLSHPLAIMILLSIVILYITGHLAYKMDD